MTLRVAFMGTPEFSVPALRALRARFDVVAVYTQPPRAAGRGQNDRKTAVHQVAIDLGLPVFTPSSLRDPAVQSAFSALSCDVAVVAAYGLILPSEILHAPRLGCINIHASLLPRWRGAAPIQRAILAGDGESGITLMLMDEGLDTGDILAMERCPITLDTTGGSLHDALAGLGAAMIVPGLEQWAAGQLTPSKQVQGGVTYATKIDKRETRLDWNASAEELDHQIRAFSPFPGAWFDLNGERVRVLMSRLEGPRLTEPTRPGQVTDDSLLVACGDGASLRLLSLQRAGRGVLDAPTFLRGAPVPSGTLLG